MKVELKKNCMLHIDMFVEFMVSNQMILFQGAVKKLQVNNQAHFLIEKLQLKLIFPEL